MLVVEDYEDTRAICAEYLHFRGFRCVTVENGLQALTKARELLPDVILMDLGLPVLDGWEATRQLKVDERTRNIPVIAFTAFLRLERALLAGAGGPAALPC